MSGARPLDGWFLEDFEVGREFAHPTPRTLPPWYAAMQPGTPATTSSGW